MGLFDRLKQGLSKTRSGFVQRVESIFRDRTVDPVTLEELEETLILSDLGATNAAEIVEHLRERSGSAVQSESIRDFLKKEMTSMLGRSQPLVAFGEKPFVILTVGVNGVGKTTTIGKLASRFRDQGHSVLLAAADTFRAAAIEQLEIWADRSKAQIVKHQSGSDPSAVVFDAIEAARARNVDIVIIDTAGRLHTKSPLMEELKKVKRVCEKAMPGAPHETLLVIDSTNGQNALAQAKMFHETVGVTGIALTKLDGTAKGGIVFAIKKELNIPVRLIGVGEGVEDLQDFVTEDFVKALFD
jgi:fused signal recognition particle receptor